MGVLVVLVVVALGAALYFATTRPCRSRRHWHRHWRHRPPSRWA